MGDGIMLCLNLQHLKHKVEHQILILSKIFNLVSAGWVRDVDQSFQLYPHPGQNSVQEFNFSNEDEEKFLPKMHEIEIYRNPVNKRSGSRTGWNEFLRQLRSNAGITRGGRRSWFGGVHMLRSG